MEVIFSGKKEPLITTTYQKRSALLIKAEKLLDNNEAI